MKLFIKALIFLIFFITILPAQTDEISLQTKIVAESGKNSVGILLEKITQAKQKKERKNLIEDLKKKLAKKNIQAQQESDAIIKAKQKIPLKIYRP